jgi:hypothetical protein
MLTQRFIQRRVDAARKAINIRLRASDVPSTRHSISPADGIALLQALADAGAPLRGVSPYIALLLARP